MTLSCGRSQVNTIYYNEQNDYKHGYYRRMTTRPQCDIWQIYTVYTSYHVCTCKLGKSHASGHNVPKSNFTLCAGHAHYLPCV